MANIRWLIQVKQKGGCRYCKQAFSDADQIVSTGQKKKYYHSYCAEKLNII
jgi:hypothetical protein